MQADAASRNGLTQVLFFQVETFRHLTQLMPRVDLVANLHDGLITHPKRSVRLN